MTPTANVKTFKIDGRDFSARADETILDVARQNNIFIPRLCELEGLSTVGACRLCLVEVKGSNRLLASCVTHVEEGMEVTTTSERLERYRKGIVELLFTERNHICSVCVSNGHCELQTMAQKLDITHVHYPYRYPQEPVDASHDRFVIDHNRCILCTRCVRVCDEIEGAHTWDVMGRGIDSKVITDLNQPWGTSDTCTSCGKCVHVLSHRRFVREGQIGRRDGKAQRFSALPSADEGRTAVSKKRMATVWLDGCSGCHMSFLDIDERLLTLAESAELVYSPLVDAKIFPEGVDVTLVEGAVSSEDDLHKIKMVRERTKTLVSLGDCAVTANVPSMRNPFTTQAVYDRAYRENVTLDPCIPNQVVPKLLPQSRPVHEFVSVDVFVPGCPPSADTIFYVVSELLAGRQPQLNSITHFGA